VNTYRRVHRTAGLVSFCLVLFHVLVAVVGRGSFSMATGKHLFGAIVSLVADPVVSSLTASGKGFPLYTDSILLSFPPQDLLRNIAPHAPSVGYALPLFRLAVSSIRRILPSPIPLPFRRLILGNAPSLSRECAVSERHHPPRPFASLHHPPRRG